MCPSSARAPRVSPDDTDAERIARLVADKARGEREGLFGPDSVTWLVLRETVLLFGGPRALLLQLAHPSVDAGIEQHSAIASDPLGRSVRTFRATYTLCFGDLASALGVVRAVHRRHTAVVGSTSTGTPYRALDPSLLRWVHATLFDTAVRMFETFVRPLSAAERARFQEESNLVEVAFGVAPDEVTSTSEAFDAYVTSVLEGDALRVTPHAVAQWGDARPATPLGLAPRCALSPDDAHDEGDCRPLACAPPPPAEPAPVRRGNAPSARSRRVRLSMDEDGRRDARRR